VATDERARTLKAILVGELAERVGLPIESLAVLFRGQDEKLLGLSEPAFSFEVNSANRVAHLGNVTVQFADRSPA